MGLSEGEIFLRLIAAVACGGLIGIERERGDRPAGVRTYIMIALGASLFTVLSIVAFKNSDPARIAAQVVVGVGFLGAGVIVVYAGTHVVGITTAATMWATAAVGMAAGAGYLLTSAYATGVILVVLVALPWVEERVIARFLRRRIYFTVRSVPRPGLVEEVTATLAQFQVRAVLLRFEQSTSPQSECSILLRSNVKARVDLLAVMDALRQLHGVTLVCFEE